MQNLKEGTEENKKVNNKIRRRQIMIDEKVQNHLNRVTKEITRLNEEFTKNPGDIGNLEHRLFWAIRGVNPHEAVCKKHNRRITRNEYGEYVCGDCIEEFIHNEISEFDENLYFDPDDEPLIKIQGIQYGNKNFNPKPNVTK